MRDLIHRRNNATTASPRVDRFRQFLARRMPVLAAVLAVAVAYPAAAQADNFSGTEQDRHLSELLTGKRSQWRDLNVTYRDGEFLRNFIARRAVRSVVEIGTSTGHSGLWIAWGLTKTGGRLVTFEIDRERHRTAQRNFAEAQVSSLIDTRLESARTGVLTLTGPIDLVFLDGDHGHYRHYVEKLLPMLSGNGCFVAHNVEYGFWDGRGYLAMMRSMPGFATEIVRPDEEAIAVTCRQPTS